MDVQDDAYASSGASRSISACSARRLQRARHAPPCTGAVDEAAMAALAFGGEGLDEAGPPGTERRSHKDIMAEVVAKSKMYKAMRQAEKAEQQHRVAMLDAQADEVQSLLRQAAEAGQAEAQPGSTGSASDTSDSSDSSDSSDTSDADEAAEQDAAADTKAGASDGVPAPLGDDEFDDLVERIRGEAREAHATDRTASAAEAAKAAASRLAELEAARLGRQQGGTVGMSGVDSFGNAAAPDATEHVAGGDDLAGSGAFAVRFGGGVEFMGAEGVQRVNADGTRATGDGGAEEAAAAFTQQLAAAAGLRGFQPAQADAGSDSDADSQASDGDQGSTADSASDSDSDDEQGGSDLRCFQVQPATPAPLPLPTAAEESPAATPSGRRGKKRKLPAPLPVQQDMPFTPECPSTLQQWCALVLRHCCTFDEPEPGVRQVTLQRLALAELCHRIHTVHSLHLGGDNKRKLLTFYGVLLDYIACTDGFTAQLPRAYNVPEWTSLCAARAGDPAVRRVNPSGACHMHGVLAFLYALSAEVRTETVLLWQTHIQRMAEQLREDAALPHPVRLRPARQGAPPTLHPAAELDLPDAAGAPLHPAWPSPGQFSLMAVALWLFPVTDFSHVVLSPVALVLAQALASAPILTPADAAAATVAATLLSNLTVAARRTAPQVLALVHDVLLALAPCQAAAACVPPQRPLSPLFGVQPAHRAKQAHQPLPWLPVALKAWSKANPSADPPRLSVGCLARPSAWASEAATAQLAAQVVASMYRLAHTAVMSMATVAGQRPPASLAGTAGSAAVRTGSGRTAPELLSPVLCTLQLVHGVRSKIMTGPLKDLHVCVRKELRQFASAAAQGRGALRLQSFREAPVHIAVFDPEVDIKLQRTGKETFRTAREADMAEQRKLKRQINREKRSFARELRRETETRTRAVDKAKASREAQREATYKGFMAEMQQQQATFHEQVKAGTVRGGGAGKAAGGGTKAKRRRAKLGLV